MSDHTTIIDETATFPDFPDTIAKMVAISLQSADSLLRPEGEQVTQATVLADLLRAIQATLARGGWDEKGQWACGEGAWIEFCDHLEDISAVADSFWDQLAKFDTRLSLPTPAGNQGGGGG